MSKLSLNKYFGKVCRLFRHIKPHFILNKNLGKKRWAISDDMRKLGIGGMAVAITALIISGDKISNIEAFYIFCIGGFLWLFGILNSKE